MIRLQKYLSDLGVASRRKSEELIKKGFIKLNGKIVTEMGIKIDPDKDKVIYNNQEIKEKLALEYYAFNKPKEVESTVKSSEKGVLCIKDFFPKNKKLFPVGRLDKDSEGLIIVTNDGVLTYKLTHPSFNHQKEYLVQVNKLILDEDLLKLERGVLIKKYLAKAKKVKRINSRNFLITLTEGKNRQIRRMCRNLGYQVIKLKRIRIGNFYLEDIKKGEYKKLSLNEVKKLYL
jgi:pseudouridine synthase